MVRCPECGAQARAVDYMGTSCTVCSCGYDERDELEVYPEDKRSQKEKGRYSPYKAGGPKRTKTKQK